MASVCPEKKTDCSYSKHRRRPVGVLAYCLDAYRSACVYSNCPSSWSSNYTLRICTACIRKYTSRHALALGEAVQRCNRYTRSRFPDVSPSYESQEFLGTCNASYTWDISKSYRNSDCEYRRVVHLDLPVDYWPISVRTWDTRRHSAYLACVPDKRLSSCR